MSILWHMDPFLGKELERNKVYSRCFAIGEYKTMVSEQRFCKHVPTETNTHITIDLLRKRDVFYLVRAEELQSRQLGRSSQLRVGI
jgi:hypothetical protein